MLYLFGIKSKFKAKKVGFKKFFKKSKTAGLRISLWTIIEIILIMLIIIVLFYFISDVREDSSFKRQALSKDLSFLTNIAQNVPGDLFYSYSRPFLNEFEVAFSEKKVIVKSQGESTRQNSYPYFDNTLVNKHLNVITKSNFINFKKVNYDLYIGEDINSISSIINCPKAKDNYKAINKFVHIVNINNSKKIIDLIINDFKFSNLNKYFFEQINSQEVNKRASSLNSFNPQNTYILFGIEITETENINDIITEIYYFDLNSDNYALICNIKDNLLNLEQISNINILPGNNERYFALNIENNYDYSFVIKISISKDKLNDFTFINDLETKISRQLINAFIKFEK
jgi:hypothetical protein